MSYFFVSNNNDIYVCGNNGYNQCGIKSNGINCIKKPVLIKNNPISNKIIKICCGEKHSLFLDINNIVYGCGYVAALPLKCNKQTSEITILDKLLTYKIVDINAQVDSSIFLDNNGKMYIYGTKSDIFTMIDQQYTNELICVNEYFDDENIFIEKIQFGLDFCCCLTNNGYVYLWGSNYYGQCGKSQNIKNVEKPTKFKENIIDIFCGRSNVFLLSKNGGIYICGRNDTNQCIVNTKKKCIYYYKYLDKQQIYDMFGCKEILDISSFYGKVKIVKVLN